MAKNRSSAVGRSSKPKPQTKSRPSGLSSNKARSKKSRETVKYGQLSRKEKTNLEEYGELTPRDLDEEEEDEEIEGQRLRKVVNEEDLDEDIRKRKYESAAALDDDEEEDEDDWQKPSAYNRLIGILQKTSKHQDFYKRMKLEEEGLEDQENGMATDEDEDDEEPEEQVLELTAEEERELREKYGDDYLAAIDEEEYGDDQSDGSEVGDQDNEEEEEDVASEDDGQDQHIDDADDSDDEDGDASKTHFGDEQSQKIAGKVSKVEAKAWGQKVFEDAVLKSVTTFSVSEKPPTSLAPPANCNTLNDFNVKQRIQSHWLKVNEECLQDRKSIMTPLQKSLFHTFNQYQDVAFCNRDIENAKEIRRAYALHALNHVLKNRDRVMKNNERISKAQKANRDIEEIRDQGFTRPKVLIILPFRNTAVDVVNSLIELSGSEQQEHKKRFFDEFNLMEEEEEKSDKPLDYQETFKGNIDDHFRLGIKFTRKTMKLYSDFYSADIIIASPLGLRTAIGAEGDKKRDFDFLSSLEVIIMDQTQQFLMQNWDHIEHIMEHVNLIPKDAHGCDFSRVKSWYLDGRAKYLRQTLIFADFLTPEINALFNKYMKNVAGKHKIKQSYDGSMVDVIANVQQTFIRLEAQSLATVDDLRFKYFIEKTLPTLQRSSITQSHTLIFVPSYFDFVRLRNYLEDNKYSYAHICEYTPTPQVSKARSDFFHGRVSFVLYTERFHFFRRYNIRGSYHVIFYGLPDHPSFYTEIVNYLALKADASSAEEATFSCSALFSKYDMLKLERIVGTDRAKKMCTSGKNLFAFS
ncbi:rRNA-binding ribosome biosynthesis protein utp25 [Umbelopsis sp. WA50703]